MVSPHTTHLSSSIAILHPYAHHTSHEKRGGGGAQSLYSLNTRSARTSTCARAFTLIELLVVIAIIGILSAVVLASLNIARERGKEAAIKSTLKSMATEIELMAETQPNYNFVNNCHTAGHLLEKYVTALGAQSAVIRCNSSPSLSGVTDNYSRWGVAVSTSGSTLPLKAWSASPEGVVMWDAADSNGGAATSWGNAVNACAAQGKKLATPEEYRALWSITVTNPGPSFLADYYWSRTEVPGVSANAYINGMNYGNVVSHTKSNGGYVRCVK